MDKVKVIDNFFDKDLFKTINDFMMGDEFAWFYNSEVDYEGQQNRAFQFTHIFYNYQRPQSPNYDLIDPFFEKLGVYCLSRIKANLLTRTDEIFKNDFHVDEIMFSTKQMKQWTTAIFYLNTNNGYTEFKDGTIINSVANRMVTFPMNMKHRGTTCTDEKTRVLINFNYYVE